MTEPNVTEEHRINERIVLAARPVGVVGDEHFRVESLPVPTPGPAQMLVQTLMFSLDPYMRGRMNDGPSYATPVAVGEVMTARGVGRVLESNLAGFAPGDVVFGHTGWQQYVLMDGVAEQATPAERAMAPRRLDPDAAPPSTTLGVLGMPGFTAWAGLDAIGRPQSGETVVVSAATGAVGSVAGQIARIRGCRVVGVAGTEDKCRHAVDELGFDACVNHRDPALAQALGDACADGIDVYFENVGGVTFHAVLPLLNRGARIPVCGSISNYNGAPGAHGIDYLALLQRAMTSKRLLMQGFIVSDHWDRFAAFEAQMQGWLRDGLVRYREDVVEGLKRAPQAFQGLLAGRNFGKLIVRVAR